MCAEEPWHIHCLLLWGWILPFGGALIWRPTHSILWAGNTVENIFLGSQINADICYNIICCTLSRGILHSAKEPVNQKKELNVSLSSALDIIEVPIIILPL